MTKYKVTAVRIEDLYLILEADSVKEAYDKAESRPEDFIVDEEYSGEWRVEDVYHYTDEGEVKCN